LGIPVSLKPALVSVPVALAVVAVFLWVAGVVAVAVGSIVVAGGSSIVVVAVARINIVGFKGFFYEVFVIVLENVVFLQEAAGVGNGHLCLFPSLFVE